MFKKGLLTLLLMGLLPVFAGEVEDAINKNQNVFLYLYTPKCKYCVKFSPIYNQLAKAKEGNYTYIKVDASSRYGYELMRKYRGRFVPYVLLVKKDKAVQILPNCLMDSACVKQEIKKF